MKTLPELLQSFKGNNSDALIYLTNGQRSVFSYEEIYDHSLRLASWLKSQDVGPDDRVALWVPSGPLSVVCFFAVMARGAIAVPINFSYKKKEADKIIKRSGSKLTIDGHILKSSNKVDLVRVSLTKMPGIIEKFRPIAPVKTSEEGIAQIIFTSGTSGEAKGVCLTHKNLISTAENRIKLLPEMKTAASFLSLVSFSQIFGQMSGCLAPLRLGATVIFVQKIDIQNLIKIWSEEDVSVVILMPYLLKDLKNYLQNLGKDEKEALIVKLKNKFQFFICGGNPMELEAFNFWQKLNMPVLEGYGLTECSPTITLSTPTKWKFGMAGVALPNTKIKIAKDGEILVKAPNVFKEYWMDKKSTGAAFDAQGWFKTGDLGKLENGYLAVFGRKDETITTASGHKVFPANIEKVLNAIEGVKESCVVGKRGKNGEKVHAALILQSNKVDPRIVIKQANKLLPKKDAIKSFSLWPSKNFSKTVTSKIQRFRVNRIVNDYA